MDFSRDELRRQRLAIERDHRAAMGRWRDVLGRTFEPGTGAGTDQKAAVLGLPTRRQFFRIGGLTVAGSALLVACGDDDDEDGAATTTGLEATTTTAVAATESDLTLLRTASSIEVLAIDTYQAAVESGLVTDKAVADAALLFQEQHRDHAAALQAQTESSGGEAYTDPNPYLQENVVDPAVAALTDQLSVVRLALELENAAAQTYALAGGLLSTSGLRQTIMSIGGVEARHAAVLHGVLDGAGTPQVPVGFMPTASMADQMSV